MWGQRTRRGWRRVAGIALVALAPTVPVFMVTLTSTRPGEVLRSSQLLTSALVLGAAVFVYFHWRVSGRSARGGRTQRHAGWLTAGLFCAAVHGLVVAAVLGQVPTRVNALPALVELGFLVVLAGLIGVARRVAAPGDPALLGTGAGMLVALASVTVSTAVDPLPVGPLLAAALNASLVVAALVAAWVLIHSRGVTWWARGRLVVALFLMAAANWIADLASGGMVTAAIAGVLSMEAAMVVCVMAQALLRRSMLAQEREVQELHETLAQARVDITRERELLHEVGSTVAGITSATTLMGTDLTLPHERRERLQHLVDLELARLERLMVCRASSIVATAPASRTQVEADLDAIVERLVTSHRLRGLEVEWTPRGLRCAADPDDLAQVVNILLENARRHGGGQVRLDSEDDGGWLVLTCADRGPGVEERVRSRIFESGVRASTSPGQGLGLGIARRLVEQSGGNLVLADGVSSGATFVARLPKKEMSRVAAHGA